MQAWFDVNGASVLVTADDENLIAPLLLYLDELSAPASPPARFHLILKRSDAQAPPADAKLLCEGAMPEGLASQMSQAGDSRWFNVPGVLSFEYSLQERWGRLSVAPGSESALAGTPAIVVVNTILAATGQFLLHAAGLRIGDSDRAFAMFARSGAGKTTTTLALTLSGFGFLTDDATVLMPPQGPHAGVSGFRIWGLPRALKVHHLTRDLLPHIAPLLGPDWNSDGEQVLQRQTLRTIAEVCPPRPFALAAVVLLGSRVEGAHVLRQVSKAEVMLALADDNVRRGPHGVLADDLARFQAISAAVAATPTYELRVGSDLASVGPLMASVLG